MKFDVNRHNDESYDPPSPWNVWSDYAHCWTCRHCGAAAGFLLHNDSCFELAVQAELKVPMTQSREDAVWAATYVRVLSTFYHATAADQGIQAVAEALGDPTKERMELARRAACEAVVKLRRAVK